MCPSPPLALQCPPGPLGGLVRGTRATLWGVHTHPGTGTTLSGACDEVGTDMCHTVMVCVVICGQMPCHWGVHAPPGSGAALLGGEWLCRDGWYVLACPWSYRDMCHTVGCSHLHRDGCCAVVVCVVIQGHGCTCSCGGHVLCHQVCMVIQGHVPCFLVPRDRRCTVGVCMVV